MASSFYEVVLRAQWVSAKARLKAAKADESKLRIMLVGLLFPDAKIGNFTYSGLTGGFKLNHTLSKDHNALMGALSQIAAAFPDLSLGGLVDWTPKLNEAEYYALPDAARRLLDPVLTIKRAMPTLTLATEKDEEE